MPQEDFHEDSRPAGRRRPARVAVVPLTAIAQETLTNESIMSMVKGGLSEAVVLARVRSGPANFDTSTNALADPQEGGRLRQDHRGDGERAQSGRRRRGGPGAGRADSAGGHLAERAAGGGVIRRALQRRRGRGHLPRDSIYYLNGAKYVELQPQVIEIETNVAFFTQKSEVVLGGRKAEARITEKQPQFYSYYAPTEALLVKLKPGDTKNDRNLKMGSGGFFPGGGTIRHGVRNEDRIAVKSEREANGFYRITPASPLAPGEYGFVVLSGATASGRMFDFGID
jgi:hypothetical protein